MNPFIVISVKTIDISIILGLAFALKANPILEYIAPCQKEPFGPAASLADRCLCEPFKGRHWVVACPGVARCFC